MSRQYVPALAALLLALLPASTNAQSLRGSSASLTRQNRAAERHDFTYLRTASQVRQYVEAGYLVEVPARGAHHEVARGVSFPYARPAVRTFVARLAEQYHHACGEKLVVTSLTRPMSRQPRNASDRSVHPTGMAMDLRRSRRPACQRWIERVLLDLERAGVLEATRERRPPHYHVALYPEPYTAHVARLEGGRAEGAATIRLAAAAPGDTAPGDVPGDTAVAGTAADMAGPAELAGVDAVAAGDELAAGAASEDTTYRVRRGDSLWGIARAHDTTVRRLKSLNGLSSSRILPGQVIRVR
jgi:hypothetical protein